MCKSKNDFSKEELAWKYNSLLLAWSKDGEVMPKSVSEKEFCEMDFLQVSHFLKNTYNGFENSRSQEEEFRMRIYWINSNCELCIYLIV